VSFQLFVIFFYKQHTYIILLFASFRTTKTGGLPNLSFVARKPEPLGTEFKNIVDGMTGAMLWLEIQEGKERMRQREYTQDLGGTAACVLRGVKDTAHFKHHPDNDIEDNDDTPYLFFGDSWFGSVKAAANVKILNHHACFMVKTAHSRSPKKFLEETMQDFPGGTWITLEGQTEKEKVDLICIGYKYNKKKVLTFVMTRGAGSSKNGEPYEARFPDKYGNVCVRHVARPDIVSNYFKFSNCVDLHNQSRQFDLALEKRWVTQDPYFRLYTTMVGMTAIDAWKISRLQEQNNLTIKEYSDILAADMIDAAKKLKEKENSIATIVDVDADTATTSSISLLTSPASSTHTKVLLEARKQVRCIWCSRIHLIERKTTMKCLECDKGFCRDQGRDCWSHHIALGGIPVSPKRGTKKRLIHDCDGLS